MGPSLFQTRDQIRMHAAYTYAQEALSAFRPAPQYKAYVSLVKKMPSYIGTNGLGQTLAFLAAKTKSTNGRPNPERLLYNQLETWLIGTAEQPGPYYNRCSNEPTSETPLLVLYRLTNSDSTTYRRATMEAISLIAILKSCSESLSVDHTTRRASEATDVPSTS